MIPLKDTIPSKTTPFVNYALIFLNIAVFIYQMANPETGNALSTRFGAIPIRTFAWFIDSNITAQEAFLPLFSYMFLHGGFMHIAGNMLYLWIFGNNVEDYFGHVGYFFFYLLGGMGAALIQYLFHLSSSVPIIGASGAIAAVMGAYLILYPHAKIVTLVPILIMLKVMELPAVLFMGFWILLQFVSASGGGGGVAWWAHIGGFFVGIFLLSVTRKIRKRKIPKHIREAKVINFKDLN